MPDRVRINEVSPRDGLQNEPGVIPAADKARLVELLASSGVDEVEVSSFVSARWVPQLGDAAEVFAALRGRRPPGVVFSALTPNEKGLDAALAVNEAAGEALIGTVSVFTAASETFCAKNINATITESFERFAPVVRRAAAWGLGLRVYISCAVACPFEGPIAPAAVAGVARRALQLLADHAAGRTPAEIDLGDTIGAGTPDTVSALVHEVRSAPGWSESGAALSLHLHDTFGRAASCVAAGLAMGVRRFDASAAGLGGCPYASTPTARAPGNIDTAALVRAVRAAGYACGVDDAALEQAARFARRITGRAGGGA